MAIKNNIFYIKLILSFDLLFLLLLLIRSFKVISTASVSAY